jgi:hypothetical protein
MTLNYWMMMERCPNLKEEVGGSIPDYEISSPLDIKTCQMVNCLMCFGASMLAFYLKKEEAFDEYLCTSSSLLLLCFLGV